MTFEGGVHRGDCEPPSTRKPEELPKVSPIARDEEVGFGGERGCENGGVFGRQSGGLRDGDQLARWRRGGGEFGDQPLVGRNPVGAL